MGVKLVSASGGSVEINPPATASSFTATMPAGTGNVVVAGINSAIVSGTSQASTSGTSIDFTGIPSWVRRITVMFNGVSTNGSSNILIQLGDSGGFETTGYVGYGVRLGSTGGLYEAWSTGAAITNLVEAANLFSGSFTIQLLSSNLWVITGVGGVTNDTNRGLTMYGTKTLSDTLTQVRITTVGGTNTFDAGSINILYE